MSEAIGLSTTVYGLGSGLFFISYALFQLPSNMALDYFWRGPPLGWPHHRPWHSRDMFFLLVGGPDTAVRHGAQHIHAALPLS